MMTKKDRDEVYVTVGIRYSKRILEILAKNNVVNDEGKPYSDATVRAVFRGDFNNEGIENAFKQLVQEVKTQHLETSV